MKNITLISMQKMRVILFVMCSILSIGVYSQNLNAYKYLYIPSLAYDDAISLARALPEYEWLAPEIMHEPYDSIAILNDWARTFLPELIVGTSMGGMLALYVDAPNATKLVINPSLEMERTLRQRGYGKHPYLQEREDGATEFIIDEPMIQRFVVFKKEQSFVPGARNLGLFSTDDEMLGHEMSKRNAKVLEQAGYEIVWSNKFGHRCNDNAVKEIVKMLKNR